VMHLRMYIYYIKYHFFKQLHASLVNRVAGSYFFLSNRLWFVGQFYSSDQ